jgi:predicted metal-dependent hydrolase
MEYLQLGQLKVEVELKDIKNIHLSVYPPKGRVHISAPTRMNMDTIRIYAISKMSWIKKQQEKILSQEREAPREYITKESHYFLGKRYLLKVIELDTVPIVNVNHTTLELYVRPGSSLEKRREILENWYREQLRTESMKMISEWEQEMNLKVVQLGIKKMKTKWGTCNEKAKRIWINFELVKKPMECIEYIIVHEMVHLLERNHNDKFIAYMNHYLPTWRQLKKDLNKLPVSHVDWGY